MNSTLIANLWLALVATIWGLTFPLIKNAITHIDPYSFVVLRFGLASLLLLPFIYPEFRKNNVRQFRAGIILGLLNSAAYTLQTLSLQYIGSSRCAFINGSFVVMVPLLSPLFKIAKLQKSDMGFALICLVGLFLLTGASIQDLNQGDALVFSAAMCAAFSIVYLQKVSKYIISDKLLCFYQIALVIPMPLIFMLTQAETPLTFSSPVIIAILFCALLATIVTIFLQTKYQRDTTAAKAALIFMLEPVFATLFGLLINGEKITINIFLGGMVMLCSIIGSSWFHSPSLNKGTKNGTQS